MSQIKVYPAKKTALVIKHPIEGQLRVTGSMWTDDGFTARMLTDGEITTDEGKAWKPDPPVAPQSSAPQQDHAPDHSS